MFVTQLPTFTYQELWNFPQSRQRPQVLLIGSYHTPVELLLFAIGYCWCQSTCFLFHGAVCYWRGAPLNVSGNVDRRNWWSWWVSDKRLQLSAKLTMLLVSRYYGRNVASLCCFNGLYGWSSIWTCVTAESKCEFNCRYLELSLEVSGQTSDILFCVFK